MIFQANQKKSNNTNLLCYFDDQRSSSKLKLIFVFSICHFRYMLITKCEAVASALDSEIKAEIKASTGITLKPKQEFVAKSASQIINEQRGK